MADKVDSFQHKVILFLCTANSCRSQMAEGFARQMAPAGTQIYSAGIFPVGVNQTAAQVMRECGIDIGLQTSKGLSGVPLEKIETLITLCGYANEYCPSLPRPVDRYHWPIEDPIKARGTQEQILKAFRKARDEIRGRIQVFFKEGQSH